MDCPKCRLTNPPSAMRCDCGYDFTSRTVEQSYLQPSRSRVSGGLLTRLSTTDGRMSRGSFWGYQLVASLVAVVSFAALSVLGSDVALVCSALVLVPALGVTSITTLVQRLHDAGHSGYWALLGSPAVLYGLVADSDRDNVYGEASSAW